MPRPRTVVSILVAVGAVLASTAPARAAAVGVAGGTLTYTGGSPEANDLVVDRTAGSVRFEDPGITITAPGSCTGGGTSVVTCPAQLNLFVNLAQADTQDDRVEVLTGAAEEFSILVVMTGGGNDTVDLSGATVTGTAALNDSAGGNDVLRGPAGTGLSDYRPGPGDDTVVAGPGGTDGFVAEATPDGRDVYTSSTGIDEIDYSARTTGVRIVADGVANDGADGEQDDVGAFEIARGGSGDDRMTLAIVGGGTLEGGDGADQLTGGPGPEQLLGGAGADVLDGGGGDDVLTGGTGNDDVTGGDGDDTLDAGTGVAPDGDRLRGGPGEDSVSYAGRSAGVTVDEDGVADDGETGEGDDVGADVEIVIGTGFADAITGGAGTNRLFGGAGPDVLDGGAGADLLRGGAGADQLLARDGAVDDVGCGTDADSATADAADLVDASCETVDRAAPPATDPPATQQQAPATTTRVEVPVPGPERVVTAPWPGCKVPRIVGVSAKVAVRRLGAAGCRYRLKGRGATNLKGRVARSSVAAGRRTKARVVVTLARRS